MCVWGGSSPLTRRLADTKGDICGAPCVLCYKLCRNCCLKCSCSNKLFGRIITIKKMVKIVLNIQWQWELFSYLRFIWFLFSKFHCRLTEIHFFSQSRHLKHKQMHTDVYLMEQKVGAQTFIVFFPFLSLIKWKLLSTIWRYFIWRTELKRTQNENQIWENWIQPLIVHSVPKVQKWDTEDLSLDKIPALSVICFIIHFFGGWVCVLLNQCWLLVITWTTPCHFIIIFF